MVKLTPSRLRIWESCPQQFNLLFLTGGAAGRATSPALSFGQSVHAVLDELHRPGAAAAASPEDLLRRHWVSAGYRSADHEAENFETARWALARFRALPDGSGRVIATEVYLSRVLIHGGQRFELSCRADRLDLFSDGTLEVLDYKTNLDGQVPPAAELAVDLPTFIYYLLARVTYPNMPRVRVSQFNVLSLQKSVAEYTDELRSANKARLLAVVAAIEAGEFGPRPGAYCGWCPAKARCPAFGPEAALDEL